MESKNKALIIMLDRISIIGIALSILLILQPFWPQGFKAGFFMTIFFTIMQIIFSHMLPKEE